MLRLRNFRRSCMLLVLLPVLGAQAVPWNALPRELPEPQRLDSASINRQTPVTRLAFGSCYKAQRRGAQVWSAINAMSPQLFIFAGDTLYPDEDDDSSALLNLREAYADLASLEPFAALRRSTPVLPVWDDHDFGRNDGGADFAFREEAEALFESAWVHEQDPRRERPGVYFSELIGEPGKMLQLIVLDTRYFRSPFEPSAERGARGRERYVPDPDPEKTLLGDAQWAWLEKQLARPADLRIIVSSIQVLADGHGWEGWRHLPRERERLFALLREHDTARVLLLSGDRHVAGFYERDVGLAHALTEFTSSALNNTISFPNRRNTLAEAGPYRLGELFGEANFGSIEIDWKAGVFTLSLHDAQGEVRRLLTRNLIN